MRTVRASFFGFPARRRRWERALRTGLWREATRAAMERAVRTRGGRRECDAVRGIDRCGV